MDTKNHIQDLILPIANKKKQSEIIRDAVMNPITIFKQEKSSLEINGDFIFFQTFIEMLLRMNSSPSDQNDLIAFLRQKYSTCVSDLRNIDEFEKNTSPNRAIVSYTSSGVFSDILNEALRTQNIYALYRLRPFIIDLYRQLTVLQNENAVNVGKVYRFQLMSKDELEKIRSSVNNHIAFRSFLSTSIDENHPINLQTSAEHDPCVVNWLNSQGLVPVLFVIHIDSKVAKTAKPFSVIECHSLFPHERECLFMLGSIFTIESVQKQANNDRSWLIHLKLCSEDSHALKEELDQIKKYDGKRN